MARREESLAKNTMILAIGNFGSKLVQIILVPFYTRVMTTSEYGTVDIMQALVQLLLPIVAISIFESVFRYAMEKEYDTTAVFTVGITVTFVGITVMSLIGGILSGFFDPTYIWLVIANTAVVALWTLLSQYARAIGKTVLFSANNVLVTFLVLIFNLIFLMWLKMGITGYMLGYILANLFSALHLAVGLKKDFKLSFKNVNKKLFKEMLIFAIPLVFNGICWWLSSFTDRIMIVYYLDASENGIYAAASKIPHLLSVVVTIFYQAWQTAANQEFKSRDVSEFYSKIYEQNSACTFLMGSALIVLSRPINMLFLGSEYSKAWVLMPTLILSTVFFSFSQFLIAVYSANKKTTMALVTNMVCVVSNIVLNALLIPKFGTLGAAVATAASYVILWFVRIFDTGKIVKIKYKTFNIAISSLIVILQSVLVCADLDIYITYSVCVIGTAVLMFIYRKTLISILKFGIGILKQVLHKNT